MKNLAVIITIFIFGLPCVKGWAQDMHNHFKIYDTRNKSIVTLQAIVDRTLEIDVLFFGEEHNDSIGHFVQDTLYKALVARYSNVTLSMEMFERDCQLVVTEYIDGLITEAQLIKEGRAWKNYSDYAPLVNTAQKYRQSVIAANSPRRYVNMVSRKGLLCLEKLDKASKKNFASLPIDTTNTVYAEKFSVQMGKHAANRNVYYAQSLWDATMAESIYKSWRSDRNSKILQLNGRFHSDERLGTVTQLQRKNTRLRLGTISCFRSEDFENPDWSKYSNLADFVIATDAKVPTSF